MPNKTDNQRILHNTKARSRNHFCRGKAISITYYECVFVTLVCNIKSACAVLCSRLACLVLQNFFTLSHKGTIFKEKDREYNFF